VSGWSGIAREAPRLAALASTAPPGIEAIAPFRLLSFHKAIDQSIFVVTYFMAITFDPAKRDITLRERGIDFATDAEKVFAGQHATFDSDQKGHGELRQVTGGWLDGRMVMMVWTARGDDQHIISMRYCHAGEAKKLRARFKQT
jgi:hypothetical protein